MGFGTLAANLIMFIAVIMLAGSLVIALNVYVQQTQDSLQNQQDRLMQEMRSEITIDSVNYEEAESGNEEDITEIFVRNSGRTDLRLDRIDVYLDGPRVSREDTEIELEEDTIIGSSEAWNPRETIKITVEQDIDSGEKTVRVTAEYGASDTYTFEAG